MGKSLKLPKIQLHEKKIDFTTFLNFLARCEIAKKMDFGKKKIVKLIYLISRVFWSGLFFKKKTIEEAIIKFFF